MNGTHIIRTAIAAAVALAFVLAAPGCTKKKEEAKQASAKETESPPNVTIESYSTAPDVDLKALDGSTMRLSSTRGNIVILSFLATWSNECKAQVPALNELQDKLQRYRFVMLGVFTDTDPAAVQSFVHEHSIRFPVYVGGDSVVARFGGLRRLPTTYILLRDGSIYDREVGPRSMTDFDDKIKEILSQRL